MKVPPAYSHAKGFNRLELIIVLATLALLAAVAWPAFADPPGRSGLTTCRNNLRRIGHGFHVWASDHDDRFPWTVVSGGPGTSPMTSNFYLVVSNEFATPQIWLLSSQNRGGLDGLSVPEGLNENSQAF